jgi:hypothetical protein
VLANTVGGVPLFFPNFSHKRAIHKGRRVVLMSTLELIALLGLIVSIISAIVKNNDKKK